MTTFADGDRGRIVDALNLSEELNRPNSVLETLMTQRERDDVSYSVDRVGAIRDRLDTIESLQPDLEDPDVEVGTTSLSIDGQYSESSRSSDPQSRIKTIKEYHVGSIRKWLDPDNRLQAYSLSSRVIRTL